MDDHNTVLKDAAIGIEHGRIVWIGDRSEATKLFVAKSILDGTGRIAMPGLIDAHVHTAQQLLRGKLSELGRRAPLKIPVWKNYYIPFESILDPEDVYLSALFAYANMIRVGTTCFADAGGPHPDEMGRAAVEVGIRGRIALSTIDQSSHVGTTVPDSMIMTTQRAYDDNVGLVNRWRDGERVSAWLGLRQIIVCSPELIKSLSAVARERNLKIHTHLCEGTYEVDYSAEKFGRRPTEYLDDLGVLGSHLHCAHSVLLSPAEVDLYQKHRLSACHCAFNNYSIGAPRLVEMWQRGIDIGLGTDGAAAWGTLDIFQVAHMARVGQQTLAGTPWHIRTAISSEEILKIATRGGARALGLDHEIGSLEIGKRADILLVDCTEPDQQPMYDPLFVASSVVVGRDVQTVLIDGNLVMKDRQLLTIDPHQVKARVEQRLPWLMDRFETMVGAGTSS
jgi:5-methylthioadenosine/S-adenosylhomocysteine deaminase